MSIPLVQNNEKDSINTSIIAIKRQIERIDTLLGLSNSEEIDTSVFATKEELEDAVTQVETDLAPVDEVTLNNMHSVTSNAVAVALSSTVVAYEVSSSNTDFIMVRLPTGDYLGLGWNKAQLVVSGTITGISIATPSGYTLKKIINGDGFAESNSNYVRKAMHPSGGNIYMYLADGTYKAGSIRVQALYSKNS